MYAHRFVDLTHSIEPGIPYWKGFPDETREDLFTYQKDGFWAQRYGHVGQWGTHVDPPAHFHLGLRTVDQIPVDEMIQPLVVINVSKEATRNPDLVLADATLLPTAEAVNALPSYLPKGVEARIHAK